MQTLLIRRVEMVLWDPFIQKPLDKPVSAKNHSRCTFILTAPVKTTLNLTNWAEKH